MNQYYIINNKGRVLMDLNQKVTDKIIDVKVSNNSVTINTIKGYSLDQPLTLCSDYKDTDIVANDYQLKFLGNEKFSKLEKIANYDLKTYLKDEFNLNGCSDALEKYPNYIIS